MKHIAAAYRPPWVPPHSKRSNRDAGPSTKPAIRSVHPELPRWSGASTGRSRISRNIPNRVSMPDAVNPRICVAGTRKPRSSSIPAELPRPVPDHSQVGNVKPECKTPRGGEHRLAWPGSSSHLPKVAAESPSMTMASEKIHAIWLCFQSSGADLPTPRS